MTASERIREARKEREYADQRAHDVAWLTAAERNELDKARKNDETSALRRAFA